MNEIVHPKGKLYYSMGEVCELFGVKPSLLRFWEENFSILKPRRNAKGNRLFTPADVDVVGLIYHLVKERGMTLAGAEKKIKEDRKGKNSLNKNVEIIQHLQKIRNLLREVKEDLDNDENVVARFDDDYAADEPTFAPESGVSKSSQPAATTASPASEEVPAAKRRKNKATDKTGAQPAKRGRKKRPKYEEQYLDLFSLFETEQVSVDVDTMEQMNEAAADDNEAIKAAWEESAKQAATERRAAEEETVVMLEHQESEAVQATGEEDVAGHEVTDEKDFEEVESPQEEMIEIAEPTSEAAGEQGAESDEETGMLPDAEEEPQIKQVFF